MPEYAVFLDRDGVLIKDTHLLVCPDDMELFSDTLQALELLKSMGYKLLVVTNQTVISRGMATPNEVAALNNILNDKVNGLIDRFYVCPHHPQATLEYYRVDCECRKPKPGMLLQGAEDFGVSLDGSWMIGDRISDIVAGQRAGCNTIQVCTGMHSQKAIISSAMPDNPNDANYKTSSLLDSAKIILREGGMR